MKARISLEALKAALVYESATGKFRWRYARSGVRAGAQAGSIMKDGYRIIGLNGAQYMAHHLAWFYVYGEWPVMLDHRDLNKDNNEISNLRITNNSLNQANTRPPIPEKPKGVTYHKKIRKWQAQIKVDGRSIYLGVFPDKQAAHAAYRQAADKHFGSFARMA